MKWMLRMSLLCTAAAVSAAHADVLDRLPPNQYVKAGELAKAATTLSATAIRVGPAALVRIRFPASATPEALHAWTAMERDRLTRVSARTRRAGAKQSAPASYDYIRLRLQDRLNKSAYYAAQLHQTLSAVLPPQSVIAEPFSVQLSAGRLVASRISPAVPSMLEIEFSVRRGIPDFSSDGYPVHATTLGRYLCPEFVIATSTLAWPGSYGVMASSLGNDSRAESDSRRKSALAATDVRNLGGGPTNYLDFAARIGDMPERDSSSSSVARDFRQPALQPGMELLLPPACAEDAIEVVRKARDDAPAELRVATSSLISAISSLVVRALHAVDPYWAVRSQLKEAISRYDPAVGALWPASDTVAETEPRRKTLIDLISTERVFLGKSGESLVQYISSSDPGQALQAQLMAEEAAVQERARAERKASTSKLTSGLLGFGAAILAGATLDDPTVAGQLAGQAIVDSVTEMSAIEDAKLERVQNVLTIFERDASKRIATQVQVHDPVNKHVNTIAASSLENLRAQLLTIYHQVFLNRAPPVERSGCPSDSSLEWFVTDMRWIGSCASDKPSGYGYFSGSSDLSTQTTEAEGCFDSRSSAFVVRTARLDAPPSQRAAYVGRVAPDFRLLTMADAPLGAKGRKTDVRRIDVDKKASAQETEAFRSAVTLLQQHVTATLLQNGSVACNTVVFSGGS